MSVTAKALYDFQGDSENGELSFFAGSEITVFRQVLIFFFLFFFFFFLELDVCCFILCWVLM